MYPRLSQKNIKSSILGNPCGILSKYMKHSRYITFIGWTGTFILFAAYALNSLGFIESTGPVYAISNIIAALLLGIRVYADRNWSNLVLEIFFGLIGFITLIRYIL